MPKHRGAVAAGDGAVETLYKRLNTFDARAAVLLFASDANNTLNFNDLTGQKGLIGTTSPGQNPGDVYGSWESPDKKMLVIGDRTDGVVELEFNLLLGDKPKP